MVKVWFSHKNSNSKFRCESSAWNAHLNERKERMSNWERKCLLSIFNNCLVFEINHKSLQNQQACIAHHMHHHSRWPTLIRPTNQKKRMRVNLLAISVFWILKHLFWKQFSKLNRFWMKYWFVFLLGWNVDCWVLWIYLGKKIKTKSEKEINHVLRASLSKLYILIYNIMYILIYNIRVD